MPCKLNHTWNGEAVQPYVDDLVQRVTNHPKIDVHLNAEVTDVQGFVGNFVSTITSEGRETEVAAWRRHHRHRRPFLQAQRISL